MKKIQLFLFISVLFTGIQCFQIQNADAAMTWGSLPGGWGTEYSNSPQGEIRIVTDEKASGNASFRYDYTGELEEYVFLGTYQYYSVKPGTIYEYSAKIKKTGSGSFWWGPNDYAIDKRPAESTQWLEYSYTFTTEASQTTAIFRMNCDSACTVWVDDVVVKETGTTVNLISNAGFEQDVDLNAPVDVTGVTVEEADGVSTMRWTNPADSDFMYTDIYLKSSDALILVQRNVNTSQSFELSGLIDYKNYTYCIKTVDATGNSSTGVYFDIDKRFLIPVELSFYDPDTGNALSAVKAGPVEVRFKVKRPKNTGDGWIHFILAAYHGGRLIEVSNIKTTMTQTIETEYEELILGLQTSENCTYKGFAWTSNMIPITTNAKIE